MNLELVNLNVLSELKLSQLSELKFRFSQMDVKDLTEFLSCLTFFCAFLRKPERQ
jgi:hypothetical protein